MTSTQQHAAPEVPAPRQAPAEPRVVAPARDPEGARRRHRTHPREEYWDVETARWRRGPGAT